MVLTQTVIRAAMPADAETISVIDRQGLATGHATFRDKVHNWESFKESFLDRGGLALVAEDDVGTIAAWAGVSPTSTRKVYDGVGEVSVYVSENKRGAKFGQLLLAALIETSEKAGYWTLVAQIFPENGPSIALHKSLGFGVVGTRTKLGLMRYGPLTGHWRDVVMLERRSQIAG